MGTFLEKIQANRNNYSVQLAQYGIDNNPNMKDFADFKEALINELSSTPQGQGAINYLTEEELIELFKQSNVRDTIEMNVGTKEADEIYRRAEDTEIVVARRTDVGVRTKQRDIKVWRVGKPVRTKTHIRKGKTITSYGRAYNRWDKPQIKFLSKQKTLLKQKKTTTSKIAFEYNKEFKDNLRSQSSISSKLYRV